MKRLVLPIVVLCTAASVLADDTFVLRGGRVVPVSGPPIEKGIVVVSGGKIAAVGADVAVPAGATVIDTTGQTVYPGLIDGLTTLGLTEIGSVAGSVDTTEVGDINPHAKAWVALNPHSELIPVARANGITAALAAPEGGLISGQSVLIRLAGSTPDALTVKTPAAVQMTYPTGRESSEDASFFEEPTLKSFEEREKEKKENQEKDLSRLRNLFEEAKAYAAAVEAGQSGKAKAPKPDPVLEALAPAAGGTLPVILRADEEDDIRAAVAFAEARGLKLIVAGGLEAWRCADLLKHSDVAVLLNVMRLPRRRSDPYDAAYANPAILAKTGVRFAIVTDSDTFSRNLPYQAAMAHAFGLPADTALRAITLSPAEILGVGSRMGSIDVGKDANLVVASGDILDHRSQVTHVLIDGALQSLETRHTRLYQEFKDRP